MSTTIYTSTVYRYKGTGGLDITRGTSKDGIIFAPSWAILAPMIARRKAKTEETEAHWLEYCAAYTQEMRTSYRMNFAKWLLVLQCPEVTLLCYCSNPLRCHRTLLAKIFVILGAIYGGERK